MKKMMITLLLATFCWSAFGLESPQQDTTKKRQDTTKKSRYHKAASGEIKNVEK